MPERLGLHGVHYPGHRPLADRTVCPIPSIKVRPIAGGICSLRRLMALPSSTSPRARLWVWSASALMCAAAAGLTIRGREFATLKLGPIYSLELLWILWLVLTAAAVLRSPKLRSSLVD